MKFFLYCSRCVFPQFNINDLDIMRSALSNNPVYGVTGFLHRNSTHYFQYVEGRRERLGNLETNLRGDKRHSDFRIVASGDILYPQFAGWSMGYSQSSMEAIEANGITANDPAKVILAFLLNEADRQISETARAVENVQVTRSKRA
ncbi:MAG: BLUF domain-containing protein [Lentilitoribacter sp.]